MSEGDVSDSLLADRRVRGLVGLSGGLAIAVVAVVAIEDPTVRWMMLGVAALDAVVTPYLLGLAIGHGETESGSGWSSD